MNAQQIAQMFGPEAYEAFKNIPKYDSTRIGEKSTEPDPADPNRCFVLMPMIFSFKGKDVHIVTFKLPYTWKQACLDFFSA